MNRILTIDPSGTGTTGLFFLSEEGPEFRQFTGKDWKEHLQFLFDYITEKEPDIAVYEHTNYLNLKGKDMTALFKLFGGIEGLKLNFTFLNSIESIPVNQVKDWYHKLYAKEKWLDNLAYKVGRGGGWLYTHPDGKVERISNHQLDAYLIYQIWKKNHD